VPTALAYALAEELEQRIQLDNIYFARTSDPDAPRWQVFDRKNRFGDLDANFKDVCLRFSPAGGLKFLAEHILKLKPKYHFKDVEPDRAWRPYELGYAPFALAVARAPNWEVWGRKKSKLPWTLDEVLDEMDELGLATGEDEDELTHDADAKLLGRAWPALIHHHIEHWATRPDARDYANDDIVYTRGLDKHFGYPEPGDNDSVLACMVPVVRWHGFAIDLAGAKKLRDDAQAIIDASPVNINKPGEVRAYITAAMDETERLFLSNSEESTIVDSTKKNNLEKITAWEIKGQERCELCNGGLSLDSVTAGPCPRCHGIGVLLPGKHPAAVRSEEVLAVKTAAKERELFEKLILAGRFHASFIVIGTLSSRMAGTDGLNAQGIKHTKNVRKMFLLAWADMVLSIGDFSAFEVTIADAVCDDPTLREELLSGRKIHALFGMAMFPGKTYDEIKASAGTANDMYTKGKQGFFGTILYGGDHNTLVNKLGIAIEVAKQAIAAFITKYRGVKRWRDSINKAFCSMRQPDGKRVIWADPAEYAETFLGFRRYYTLENRICKALFDLAQKPPKEWRDCLVKVVRRERVQTAGGAVSSALYGAAFSMQASNMRSAANHCIQSPGAEITKAVERRVWDLQPCGVHPLAVAPLNVHDEIGVVSTPEMVEPVAEAIQTGVASFKSKVPLIGMDWTKNAKSWADK
jgi:hypothetical protein